jgi:hypothetical protein
MTAPGGRDTNFCLGASKTGGYLGGLCPLRCASRVGCQLAGGLLGRRPSLSRVGLGKTDRFWMGSDHLLMIGVSSVN